MAGSEAMVAWMAAAAGRVVEGLVAEVRWAEAMVAMAVADTAATVVACAAAAQGAAVAAVVSTVAAAAARASSSHCSRNLQPSAPRKRRPARRSCT